MRVDHTLLESMAQKRTEVLAEPLAQMFRENYPGRCRMIDEEKLSVFTRWCARDAYALGCENYGVLKSYAFIAWHLGTGFIRDPLYPAIEEMARSDRSFDEKMEEISEYFFEHLYPGDLSKLSAYNEALKRLLKVNLEVVTSLRNYDQIAELLERIYPQRAKLIGSTKDISILVNLASDGKITRYNIDHPIGRFVYAGLVFFLGSNFDEDPLYPWAKKYLDDKEPRMAYKLDALVKVVRKRIKSANRQIEKVLSEVEA